MVQLQGKGTGGGVAVGSVYLLRKGEGQIPMHRTEDPAGELRQLEAALQTAREQLGRLYESARERAGEESAQVFQIHQMMLEDKDYLEAIRDAVTQEGCNVQWAVSKASQMFSQMFSSMEDAYMRERAADVEDISRRLLRILSGSGDAGIRFDAPVILAAEDLSPSETVQLDQEKILAFLTEKGSDNSHTAILARTMGIPAVVGVSGLLKAVEQGMEAGVDGDSGAVWLSPDSVVLETLGEKAALQKEQKRRLARLRGLPAQTQSGRRMMLYANIGGVEDVQAALSNDAEGVGLFRTEFLYLQSRTYPTEEEQFAVYRKVVQGMDGRRVIFRTLDIGADKQADYFQLEAEENPAMGVRAIRICLERPDLFRTQLRAIYRAGAYGSVGIMFPMITSLWELQEAKAHCEAVRQELIEEGIPVAEKAEIGVMIETPAAALISGTLAAHVDFFSIGTNDLTQYTLALDRQNSKAGRFYDPHHPAVLELIRISAKAAHEGGAWCGICGELAADLSLTEQFLDWGIDELSVSPGGILPLKETIRSLP